MRTFSFWHLRKELALFRLFSKATLSKAQGSWEFILSHTTGRLSFPDLCTFHFIVPQYCRTCSLNVFFSWLKLLSCHHRSIRNGCTALILKKHLRTFQRKTMPLISFPCCTALWIWPEQCMAALAQAEYFNKRGIRNKLKARGGWSGCTQGKKPIFTKYESGLLPPPISTQCGKTNCTGSFFCHVTTITEADTVLFFVFFRPTLPPRWLPNSVLWLSAGENTETELWVWAENPPVVCLYVSNQFSTVKPRSIWMLELKNQACSCKVCL